MSTRTIIYGDVTLPDPGPDYSNEEIGRYLAASAFPELAHCRIEEKELADGTIEVRFMKEATTKGTQEEKTAIANLLDQLETATPAAAVKPAKPPDIVKTIGRTVIASDLLKETTANQIIDFVNHERYHDRHAAILIRRCQQIHPYPSSSIPIGW